MWLVRVLPRFLKTLWRTTNIGAKKNRTPGTRAIAIGSRLIQKKDVRGRELNGRLLIHVLFMAGDPIRQELFGCLNALAHYSTCLLRNFQ
jgi:hypothetical protein